MVHAIAPIVSLDQVRRQLPPDLDAWAREFRADLRLRGFPDAATPVFALLVYAATDYPLKDTSALLAARGISISPASLHERLCAAEHLLSALLAHVLAGGVRTHLGERRLRAIDATCLAGPGANNADVRIHALADLTDGTLVCARVTGAQVGEHSALHPVGAESLVVQDRGYSNAAGLRALQSAGGRFPTLISQASLPLFDSRGRRHKPAKLSQRALVGLPLDITAWTAERPAKAAGLKWGHLVEPAIRLPLRIIMRIDGKRKPLWLATNLPDTEASAEALAAVYRQRWQIELMFKHHKSLGGLDRLRSRNGPPARDWVPAKLLLFALVQRLIRPNSPASRHPASHSERTAPTRSKA